VIPGAEHPFCAPDQKEGVPDMSDALIVNDQRQGSQKEPSLWSIQRKGGDSQDTYRREAVTASMGKEIGMQCGFSTTRQTNRRR